MDSEFMKVVIKQCSNFFLGLSEYCDEYLNNGLEGGGEDANGHKPGKKLKTSGKDGRMSGNMATPEKKKRKRKPVDPNAPPRPTTAFFHFCATRREKLKQQYPGFSATEMTSVMGKEWRELSQEKLEFYQNRYKDELTAYKIKLAEYNATKDLPAPKVAQVVTIFLFSQIFGRFFENSIKKFSFGLKFLG